MLFLQIINVGKWKTNAFALTAGTFQKEIFILPSSWLYLHQMALAFAGIWFALLCPSLVAGKKRECLLDSSASCR